MNIDLNKKDLINLVKGTSPYYDEMEHPLVQANGSYTGGFVDKWSWNRYDLEELSKKDLWRLYNIVENGWEKDVIQMTLTGRREEINSFKHDLHTKEGKRAWASEIITQIVSDVYKEDLERIK